MRKKGHSKCQFSKIACEDYKPCKLEHFLQERQDPALFYPIKETKVLLQNLHMMQ